MEVKQNYRQSHMRFSRFEDFVKELLMKVEDPEAMLTIKNEFEKERKRVIQKAERKSMNA